MEYAERKRSLSIDYEEVKVVAANLCKENKKYGWKKRKIQQDESEIYNLI